MKPLERIFFMACVNEQMRVYDISEREFSIKDIAKIFSRLGFSYKQLMYYVQKWVRQGFYGYEKTFDLGWIEFDKLKGEYKAIYENMNLVDVWREKEFMQYIVKASTRRSRITNYALKQCLAIKDEGFYN